MSVPPDTWMHEHFYSQCLLPINCWKYLNAWFSLHLTKTEAVCYCPSSHLHVGFFLPCYCCVYTPQAPARHEPGTSRCRSDPAEWSSHGRPAGKSLPRSGTTASRSRQALSRSGLWLQGDCITLGNLSGAHRMNWSECWTRADHPQGSTGQPQALVWAPVVVERQIRDFCKGITRDELACL